MERCLLTGQSGFLGLALTAELQTRGVEVIPISRELLDNAECLEMFLKEQQPGYIFHLAAYGNRHYQTDALAMMHANVVRTTVLLDICKDLDLKGFVNFGSSSEYGRKTTPMKESDSLDSTSFYGSTKASATLLTRSYATEYGLPFVTVRPFSVYGQGDHPDKFIQTAIHNMQEGKIVTVSPGNHDWIYIDDFIKGVLTVADNAGRLKGQAINIGTGVQYTNRQVVDKLFEISRLNGTIEEVGTLRSYDTDCWVADNSLLKSLGWTQRFDLRDGLCRTLRLGIY